MWLACSYSVLVLAGLTSAAAFYPPANSSSVISASSTGHVRSYTSASYEPYEPIPSSTDWANMYSSATSMTATIWASTRETSPANTPFFARAGAPPIRRLNQLDILQLHSDDKLSAIKCTGSDMNKRGEVGYCADGSFLPWSGNDCAKHCSCKGDKIDCDIPDDCGPKKDVNAYCAVAGTFTCQCPTDSVADQALTSLVTDRDEKVEHRSSGVVVTTGEFELKCQGRDVRDEVRCQGLDLNQEENTEEITRRSDTPDKTTLLSRSTQSKYELECAGDNMFNTQSIGKCHKSSLGTYLNGNYCQSYCTCDGDKVKCKNGGRPEGIDNCEGDAAASTFCATGNHAGFKCGCKKTERIKRDVHRAMRLPNTLANIKVTKDLSPNTMTGGPLERSD